MRPSGRARGRELGLRFRTGATPAREAATHVLEALARGYDDAVPAHVSVLALPRPG